VSAGIFWGIDTGSIRKGALLVKQISVSGGKKVDTPRITPEEEGLPTLERNVEGA